jgi:hypothetical protein
MEWQEGVSAPPGAAAPYSSKPGPPSKLLQAATAGPVLATGVAGKPVIAAASSSSSSSSSTSNNLELSSESLDAVLEEEAAAAAEAAASSSSSRLQALPRRRQAAAMASSCVYAVYAANGCEHTFLIVKPMARGSVGPSGAWSGLRARGGSPSEVEVFGGTSM